MSRCALIAVLTGLMVTASAGPAMAGPEGIKNCRTISQPGAYVVERSLSAAGDCLVLAASNVSIDLGGFTIIGNGSPSVSVTRSI
jgi:hypothetical protein